MVSTAADVTAASASLLPILARATRESSGGPAMIGLDTESIPVTVPRRREQSLNFRQAIPQPVALLQVASEQHAFLFDLPALSTDPQACTAADKLLVRLFGEEGCETQQIVTFSYRRTYSLKTMRNVLVSQAAEAGARF